MKSEPRYREDDRFEIPERLLKMSREEIREELSRIRTEYVKSGKWRLKLGNRVVIDKNCFQRYNEWTEDPYGTVIKISNSGWSDIGGIYTLRLDTGEIFNCSIDAIVKVVEV